MGRAPPGEPALEGRACRSCPAHGSHPSWEKLCASPGLECLVSWPPRWGSHQLTPCCTLRYRVQRSLALLSQELKISVLQAQTIEKQCLRKSSQKIHSKDKVKHPAYCSVFSYQHVPPPSTIRVNIYRAAFSTSQLQFTDTNLHT